MNTQFVNGLRSRALPTGMTLLVLLLSVAFTAVCGGGGGDLGAGGDPLSIVAEDSRELELYDVETYAAQDLPDDLRERFEDTQQDFLRFGIDFEDVDMFVKAIVECCDYRKVGLAGGARVYVFDGSIDLDAVREKLEDEGFQSRMSGEYETWEKRALVEEFRYLEQFAAAFLEEEGYILLGDIDGVRETIFELSRADSDGGGSAMQQTLARIGDGWKQSGRLDAQTKNNANTHCASDVRYDRNCEATAHYSSYAEMPVRTVIATLYRTEEDAQSESDNLERNIESSDEYESVDVQVVDLNVDGAFVDATIQHDNPLRRKRSRLY